MDLTVWLGLLASALFISISPGPGAIFSISQGTQYGFKRSLFSVIGLQFGLMSQIIFLLFGLGVLIDQFPSIFKVIKAIGMIYLIALGVIQWHKKIEQISKKHSLSITRIGVITKNKLRYFKNFTHFDLGNANFIFLNNYKIITREFITLFFAFSIIIFILMTYLFLSF